MAKTASPFLMGPASSSPFIANAFAHGSTARSKSNRNQTFKSTKSCYETAIAVGVLFWTVFLPDSLYLRARGHTVTQSVRPTTCAQCEDKNSPVIDEVDGFSFQYEIIKGVRMEIFLHDDCACRWYDAFSAHAPVMEEIRKSAAQAL